MLLPGTRDLCKSIFLSSFATLVALNVAGWGTRNQLTSYDALAILGLNAILSAPTLVSIVRLSNEVVIVRTGYAICYIIYWLVAVITFGIFLGTATAYDRYAEISMYKASCKTYYAFVVIIVIFITVQIVTGFVVPWWAWLQFKMENQSQHSQDQDREEPERSRPEVVQPNVSEGAQGHISIRAVRFLAILQYGIALVLLIVRTRLPTGVSITWVDNHFWSFGQIFAVTAIIAPFIEIIKYSVKPTVSLGRSRKDPAHGISPLSYLARATNFHTCKCFFSSRSLC